jgi:hypothetical protein
VGVVRLRQNSSVGRVGSARLARLLARPLIVAFAFALTLASGSALAKPASLHSSAVLSQELVGPMKLASVTEQCPQSDPHPVGPDYSYMTAPPVGSVVLVGSFPKGMHGWFTQVENLTNQPQQMDIGVVCLRANARFAYPRTGGYFVDNRGPNYGQTNCPRSAPRAIDGYFGVSSAADAGSIALFESYPFVRKVGGDLVGIKGFASSPVDYFAGAVCTSLRTSAGYFREKVAAHSRNGLGVTSPAPDADRGRRHVRRARAEGAPVCRGREHPDGLHVHRERTSRTDLGDGRQEPHRAHGEIRDRSPLCVGRSNREPLDAGLPRADSLTGGGRQMSRSISADSAWVAGCGRDRARLLLLNANSAFRRPPTSLLLPMPGGSEPAP